MNFSNIFYNILSYSKDAFLLLALIAVVIIGLVFFTSITSHLV
jgi:hypothetical protein